MLKKLASETALYGGTTILVRLINYALVPLHTGVFQPDSYGIIAEFYAWATALNVIYTYGMETAYFRFASKKGADQQPYFNRIVTLLLLSSVVFSGILVAFSGEIATVMGYPQGQQFVIWFALLFAIDAVVAIPFAQLRILHKPGKFALTKVVNILIVFLLNVFFLVFCRKVYQGEWLPGLSDAVSLIYNPDLGLGYAFLANLLGNAFLVLLLWKSFKGMRLVLDLAAARPLLAYGVPILFSGLAFAVNEAADRIFLKYLLPDNFYQGLNSLEAVGIYAACYKLSVFITLAVQAYRYAAEPFFFSRAEDKDPEKAYALVMRYFIIACCLMFLGVVANLDWLSWIFLADEVYHQGLSVVPVLLLANIFLGIYYNLSVWFKVTDRTYFGAFISSGGAAITIFGNILLIPVLGYHGSAAATLLCYLGMAAACYLLGQKYYPVPYGLGPAAAYLLLAVLAVAVMQLPQWPGGLPGILLRNALLLLFVAGSFFSEKRRLARLAATTKPVAKK